MLIQTLVAHAWALWTALVSAQIIICLVPASLYLWRSRKKSPAELAAVLGGIHLALVLLAVFLWDRENGQTDLLWLLVCALDVPLTMFYRFAEDWVSMAVYFAVAGTGQYALIGFLLGKAFKLLRSRKPAPTAEVQS